MPPQPRPSRWLLALIMTLLMAAGWLLLQSSGLAQTLSQVYLPIIMKDWPPSPTLTATSTATATQTLTPTLIPGRILISEVSYNPGDEPEGEWLELYNPGQAPVGLDGYKIGDAWIAGAAEGMYFLPTSSILEPGQTLVIAYHAAAFQLDFGFLPDYELYPSLEQVPELARYSDWSSGVPILSNSGDELLLLDPQDAHADAVCWGDSFLAFYPSVPLVGDQHSIARYPPNQDTDNAVDWVEQAAPDPKSVRPTPTATTSITPTPTATPTLTRTSTATASATASPSTTPSRTATVTWTATPTPSATGTIIPSITSTATKTPSPTLTKTHTSTTTPSDTPTSTATPRLLISEVLYDPATGGEPGGEWIEVYNAGGNPASLSAYKIGDEETPGGGEGMLRFPEGSWLAAGEALVVANRASVFFLAYGFYPDYEMSDSLSSVPDMLHYGEWASGAVNFANSGDETLLLGLADQVVDALSWGSSTIFLNPPAADVAEGHSLERAPAGQDSDSALDWRDQPTPDPGQVATELPTGTPTSTASHTPSGTPTATETGTPTPSRTPTKTATVSATPSVTISATPSSTPTITQTATASTTATQTPTATQLPHLLLSEILADPAGVADPDGEWLEVYNAGSSTANLSGFKIGDEETRGGGEGMQSFPGEASLPAGQAVVIAHRASVFLNAYGYPPDYELIDSLPSVPDMLNYSEWASGAVNFANSGDEALLLGPADQVVDALSYGSSTVIFNPPAPAASEGYSLERMPAWQDSDSAADWFEQRYPSPGQPALGLPTSTPSATTTVTPTITPSRTSTPTRTITAIPSLTATRTYTATRTPTATPSATATATALPQLVINELLADPHDSLGDANEDGTVSIYDDEFVELFNDSGYLVDLSGWQLTTLTATRHVFPPGSLLPDQCALIVFGGGQPGGTFGGSRFQVASSGRLGLTNAGDSVILLNSSGATMAQVDYGVEAADDQALTRNPDISGPLPLVKHSLIAEAGGQIFSPGTRLDGGVFLNCEQIGAGELRGLLARIFAWLRVR